MDWEHHMQGLLLDKWEEGRWVAVGNGWQVMGIAYGMGEIFCGVLPTYLPRSRCRVSREEFCD